jgi:hypothetical protein
MKRRDVHATFDANNKEGLMAGKTKKTRANSAEQAAGERSATTPRAVDELEHAQQALDEALRESFPASDPVAVSISKPVAVANPGKGNAST